MESDHRRAICSWFSEHPLKIIDTYQWWLNGKVDSNSDFWHEEFWEALCNPEIPPALWQWQLLMVDDWSGKKRGEQLFRAVINSIWREPSAPTLEEIHTWTDRHPVYKNILEPMLTVNFSNRFTNHQRMERLQQDRIKEAAIRADNKAFIEEELDLVSTGESIRALRFLAELFLSHPKSGRPTGLDLIREEFGLGIAQAAAQGFAATLTRPDIPTPEQIGELAARREYHTICHPLVAGALLQQEHNKLTSLRESSGLQAAMAFEFAFGFYGTNNWIKPAIGRDPVTSARVITETWKPLLRAKVERIPYLSSINKDPALGLAAREIGLTLLELYPKSKAEFLEELMRIALVGTSKQALQLTESRMARLRGLNKDQYALWLTFSLLISPERGLNRAESYLRSGEATTKAYILASYLESLSDPEHSSELISNSQNLTRLIKLLGTAFGPHPVPTDAWVGRHDAFESTQLVGCLIDALGSRVDNNSARFLRDLRDNRALSAWKEKLSHTVEQQRRKVREQRYQRPSFSDVLKFLEGGGPTSLPDLHAIVCDHLRTLANEIENGPEDSYQTFWNVTGPGEKLQSPPPENVARDRLRSLFNPRLRPLGISAEIEGHYARSNRADLKIVFQYMNIPVEIKRHYHRDVWTAPRTQLKKKYSIDPEAKGFGIYLVFWFGEADGRRLPEPPVGIARPGTAAELESALRELYSGEEWRDTEFVCIDCSPRKKAAKKKGQGKKRSRKSGP